MSVITQEYDIDLKATGEYPVVKMSQFDTGSRTIVFTVYDGHDLANIDGMVARVDGTRSDGVEFSSTCTVSAGSKVSFTINQEMTKHAGKHAAELVIFDASGNPAGTQNFIIEVEPATMVRDSAASADDRTLYDQYTDSVEHKFSELSTSLSTKADALNKTVEDISGLVGASSKPSTIFDVSVDASTTSTGITGTALAHAEYDPLTGLVTFVAKTVDGLSGVNGAKQFELGTIDAKYLPAEGLFKSAGWYNQAEKVFLVGYDRIDDQGYGAESYIADDGKVYASFVYPASTAGDVNAYRPVFYAQWYARGGKYLGVAPIGTGGNTVSIGTTTTGEPGTQASVVNSGTAKDVVLDFTIPRGADGAGSSYTLPPATASTLGGVKIGSGISVTSDGTISASGGSGGLTLETVTVTEAHLYNSFANSTANIGTLKFYKYGAFVGCRGYFSITPSGDFAGNITTNDLGFKLSSAIINGFSTDNGMKTVCFVSTEDNYLMRSVTDARPLWFHFNEYYPSVDVEIPGVNLKANTTYYFQVDAVSLYFGVGNN